MKSLNVRDTNWVVRRLPKDIRELLKNNSKIFLAGGFIRSVIAGEEVNDIDLFAPDKETAYLVAKSLGEVYESDNAYSIKLNGMQVQVIHRWTYSSPVECVLSFDFTIACAAIWFDAGAWHSVKHDDYYADLAAKRLVYLCPVRNEDAGGSILRLLKFYRRGYNAPLDSIGSVIARLITGVDFDKTKNVEEVNAKVLTGLLLEVDPNIAFRVAEQ